MLYSCVNATWVRVVMNLSGTVVRVMDKTKDAVKVILLDETFLDETMNSEYGSDLDETLNESTSTTCTAGSCIQQEDEETWPGPAFGPNHTDVSLELLNNLNACSDSEDNQNELQSIEKSDSRHKCSGQSQPPPSYQNRMHSECGVVGLDLEVGQTEVNLLTYQEPEVEGTSGAGADTKKDKIQPNLRVSSPVLIPDREPEPSGSR